MREKVLGILHRKPVRVLGYVSLFIIAFIIFFYATFPHHMVGRIFSLYLQRQTKGLVYAEGVKVSFPLGLVIENVAVGDVFTLRDVKLSKHIFSPAVSIYGHTLGGTFQLEYKYREPYNFILNAKKLNITMLGLKERLGMEIAGEADVEIEMHSSSSRRNTYDGRVILKLKGMSVSGGKLLDIFELPPLSLGEGVLKAEFKQSVGEVKVGRIEGPSLKGELKGRIFLKIPVEQTRVNCVLTIKPGRELEKAVREKLSFLNLRKFGEKGWRFSISGPLIKPRVNPL